MSSPTRSVEVGEIVKLWTPQFGSYVVTALDIQLLGLYPSNYLRWKRLEKQAFKATEEKDTLLLTFQPL